MKSPQEVVDQAVDRRSARRGWLKEAGLLLSGLCVGSAARAGRSSVLQFGADATGRNDSSAAFARAIEQFDIVDVPSGTYLVGNLALRSGVALVGEGESSVLRQKPGRGFILFCDSGSADPALNLRRIAIRSLQLRGNCDTEGFDEHTHAVSLSGVTEASIEGVVFRGFRGDGLYLGSSQVAGSERHNLRVTVRDCLFDGIDHQNRNGISVIDCDGLVIERCRFVNVARHDMPGAIDLEPDANAFHVIRDVHIVDNSFKGIGGKGATVALFVPEPLTTPATRILVERNVIDGTSNAAFGFVQLFAPAPGAPSQAISVRDNRVSGNFARPMDLRGVVGVEVRANGFEGSTQAALIGGRESKQAVRDVRVVGNTFRHCGSEGGAAVTVGYVDRLEFAQNQWLDCGNGGPRSAAVAFGAGASRFVGFAGNRFASSEGRTKWAIVADGHRFAASSNRFSSDNQLDAGLRVAFEGKGTPGR